MWRFNQANRSKEFDAKVKVIEEDLEERDINVRRLGAIGDGRSHPLSEFYATLEEAKAVYPHATSLAQEIDGVAIQLALNNNYAPFFPKGQYLFNTPILKTYTTDCVWQGRNAELIYTGTHTEYAIRLSGAGVTFQLAGFRLDGGEKCNKGIEILNDSPDMNTANLSEIKVVDASVKNVRRLNTYLGGEGISVRGGFENILFDGVEVKNCILPAGQGKSGSIGITGISVTHYGLRAYPKKTVFRNTIVKKIYSEDPSYEADQDGIKVFAPHVESKGAFVDSEMLVEGATFENCYGRSIKSQTFINNVKDSFFKRTEGFASKTGNGEIDLQISGGNIAGCSFNYKNGYEPGSCVVASSQAGYGYPSVAARDCDVYLDDSTTLPSFMSNYPRDGVYGRLTVEDVRIHGKAIRLMASRVNGNKHYVFARDCFVKELVAGETGEKALIYAYSSGTGPFLQHITVEGCVYAGTDLPAVVRDSVPGTSTATILNATGNIGFSEDKSKVANYSGLKQVQISRIGRIGPDIDNPTRMTGFFEVNTYNINPGEAVVIPVRNVYATMLFIISTFNQNAYAVINSNYNNNTTLFKGSAFEIGNNTEPATGIFRVWSSGQNQISIRNTDATLRLFTIFEMAPY